jgi:hypothetical protein
VWYETLSTFLKTLGFKPLLSDMGVFMKGHTFIAVYMDDLLITGPSKDEIVAVKQALYNKFKMTDLGPQLRTPTPPVEEASQAQPSTSKTPKTVLEAECQSESLYRRIRRH